MGIYILLISPVSAKVGIFVLNKKDVLMPGQLYSMIFRLENDGDATDLSDLEILVPDYVSVVTKKFPTNLEKDGKGKIFMSFSVAENAKSGPFDMEIRLLYQGDLLGEGQLGFSVNEVHKLALQVIDKPSQVNGSDTVQCHYLVTNTGNANEDIRLQSKAGNLNSYNIALAPGESKKVVVERFISGEVMQSSTLIFDLQAQLNDPDTIYSLNIPIPYYPTRTLKIDKYFRFPVTFQVSFLHFNGGRNRVQSARYDIHGRGYLDRQQKLLVGFTARGPNQINQAQYGQYDEYRLEVALRSFGELNVGDFGVSLSPLTESSRYGRGVSYEQIIGPLRFSGFYLRPRFFPDSDLSYGLAGRFQLSEKLELQYNRLYKNFALIDGKPEAVISSVGATFTGRSMSFDLEGAQSQFQGVLDYATMARLDYSNGAFHFGGNFLYAGDEFRGYYRSTNLASLNLRVNLSDRWSVSASGTQNESSPQQDTLIPEIVPKYTYYAGGFHYRLDPRRSFTLQILLSRKIDRIEPVDYDFLDRLGQFSYYYRTDYSELNGQVSYGFTNNFLIESGDREDQRGNSFRGNIYYGYKLNDRIRVGANVEYQSTNKFTSQQTNQQLLFYGGRINYQKNDRFALSGNYRSNYPLDELFRPRSFVDAELNYRWTHLQYFSGTIGYSIFPSSSDVKQLYISFKYNHTLNVPIKKVLDPGNFTGQVIGNHGEKVGGIRLSIADQEVVTDMIGRFEFNDIPPGQHFMQINAGSMGMNEIAVDYFPVAINVLAQETVEKNIEVIKCSTIRGKVHFEEELTTQSDVFVKDMPNIFLKIVDEKSTYYTKTDEKGEFQFTGLRPGTWQLTILDSGWNSDFEIDDTEKEIKVQAAENAAVEFVVKPKTRKMKFSKEKLKLKSGE
ncbi:MAG: hypothetical protein IPL46_01540 [Saprospiraceae bacterium]|nr:hypothetical protein [Saprospiraceae bacterium]